MPPRLYTDLASWWPLLSPPSEYAEEAAHLLTLLEPAVGRHMLLELGSGGGSLASHLGAHYDLTLTDLSAEMLAVNRTVNPAAEHLQGDMRALRLGRLFDRVLIHDAIMYAATEGDLLATLTTARHHCRPGGRVVVVPDYVAETFAPSTSSGGHDAPDGRGLRYLEWTWDPDPGDTHAEVAFALVLREASGDSRVDGDRQRFGLFPRATWHALFARAGLDSSAIMDPWDRDVFVAVCGMGHNEPGS